MISFVGTIESLKRIILSLDTNKAVDHSKMYTNKKVFQDQMKRLLSNLKKKILNELSNGNLSLTTFNTNYFSYIEVTKIKIQFVELGLARASTKGFKLTLNRSLLFSKYHSKSLCLFYLRFNAGF